MKPLFIPLKSEYFDAFKSGEKDMEYRAYGPRWNERTCPVGRQAVLSRGYGKSQRLNGVVCSFDKVPAKSFGGLRRDAMLRLYGTLEFDVACIGIEVARMLTQEKGMVQ